MPSYAQVVLPENWQIAGFGLYVHWPYCTSKCPYCDFNSHVALQINHGEWIRAYCSDIARYGGEFGGRVLRSIYFGGGTPSLMPPAVVEAVIDAAMASWSPANDIEITLEANPSSVEQERFRGYRAAGVNRLSLGIQALSDKDLRALGRLHSLDDAIAALEIARCTFERVSFDLIYARQDQTLGDWRAELKSALAFSPDHLSLYQLTIEDGTAFGDRNARGLLPGLPGEDVATDLYDLTQDMTKAAGLEAYEISNHARPGFESAHNLIYWRGGDWLGVGPGAHGRLSVGGNRFATQTRAAPSQWLSDVTGDGGEARRDLLSEKAAAEEMLMMGLRLASGVERARLSAIQSNSFDSHINSLIDLGMLRRDRDHIAAAPAGRRVLNAVLRDLIAA